MSEMCGGEGMREIKFRAWDGQKMHVPEYSEESDFFITCGGVIRCAYESGYERHCLHDYRKGWELMQYTGLKDKNGVEIYEGDILHYEEWHHGPVEMMADEFAEKAGQPINHMIRCVLHFAGGAFRYQEVDDRQRANMTGRTLNIEPMYASELFYPDGVVPHMEVIGNIYENPDLIAQPDNAEDSIYPPQNNQDNDIA